MVKNFWRQKANWKWSCLFSRFVKDGNTLTNFGCCISKRRVYFLWDRYHWIKKGGGHWDFRFCGFGYFLDRFFGFRCKRLRFFGFGGHCGLRIFRFLASGFRFSWKILAVFRFWYPMWFLVFGRAVSSIIDCFFEYLFITTLSLRASSCCHVKLKRN